MTINSAWTAFFSKISMHGLTHLAKCSSLKVKVLWISIIAIACLATMLHLYNLIYLYLKYDYYESIRNEFGHLEFPDVTLCSNEGVSLYSITNNKGMRITVYQALNLCDKSHGFFEASAV